MDRKSFIVKAKRCCEKIIERSDFNIDLIFKKHWLDVEDLYRNAGWIVYYDRPGYDETYDATFEFSKPKGK